MTTSGRHILNRYTNWLSGLTFTQVSERILRVRTPSGSPPSHPSSNGQDAGLSRR